LKKLLLRSVTPGTVRNAFASATREQIALAGLCTAVSYSLLTGYDKLALRQLRVKIPFRTTALASFTSYAISFTLGFPLVTAAGVRYWIYAPRGVSAGKVASLTLIAGLTFILGMGTVVGVGLTWHASAISGLNHLAPALNRLIGLGILGTVLSYLVWVGAKRRAVRVQRFRLELPSLPVSAGQILLGIGDVCAAGAVLYVLLPPGHGIAFESFAAVYAFACILGIVSHAPGGLGVFEATILLAFYRLPYDQLIGALFLFRLCYYLVPFVIALLLLGGYEIHRRVRSYRANFESGDGLD
jgi:uncharacterized membrane protein YbhN (UPF0104 family)